MSFSVSGSSTHSVDFRTDIIELDEKNEEKRSSRRRRKLKDTSLQIVFPNTQTYTDIFLKIPKNVYLSSLLSLSLFLLILANTTLMHRVIQLLFLLLLSQMKRLIQHQKVLCNIHLGLTKKEKLPYHRLHLSTWMT